MPRIALLATAALLVLGGCLGGPASQTHTPDRATTATASPSPATTVTPVVAETDAGERAVAAEKARVRSLVGDCENLTDLSFGILQPAEYEVRERNASGVFVRVVVGYSLEFDGEMSVDGATTSTTYRVTAGGERLVAVERDVPPSLREPCGY